MSSYCLTLMAIGYLQHLGCLPNLQANVAVPVPDLPKDTTDPEVIWVGWGKEQASRAHIGFDKSPPLGWAARNPDLTVGDAIHGFFSYFSRAISPSEDRFDYTSSVMSVLNGGVLRRQHPVGIETTMEEQKRNEMKNQELPLDGIAQAMADHRQGRLENEQYMGKGDTGIQPRNWGDRKIVVQDPFLWQKVRSMTTP